MILMMDERFEIKSLEIKHDGDKRTLPQVEIIFEDREKEYKLVIDQMKKSKDDEYTEAKPSGYYKLYLEGDTYGTSDITDEMVLVYQSPNTPGELNMTNSAIFNIFDCIVPKTQYIPIFICHSIDEYENDELILGHHYSQYESISNRIVFFKRDIENLNPTLSIFDYNDKYNLIQLEETDLDSKNFLYTQHAKLGWYLKSVFCVDSKKSKINKNTIRKYDMYKLICFDNLYIPCNEKLSAYYPKRLNIKADSKLFKSSKSVE